jgi:hypothetical protein
MNTIRYKIWQWGEATGQGSNRQYNVGVATKAKRSEVNPHAIAGYFFGTQNNGVSKLR